MSFHTSCMCRTTHLPSQAPASHSASGSSPQRKRFFSMTTSWLSTIASIRSVCVCVFSRKCVFVAMRFQSALVFTCFLSLSGSGWCEKGIYQSGRDILPAPKAHWTEENDHGQSPNNSQLFKWVEVCGGYRGRSSKNEKCVCVLLCFLWKAKKKFWILKSFTFWIIQLSNQISHLWRKFNIMKFKRLVW